MDGKVPLNQFQVEGKALLKNKLDKRNVPPTMRKAQESRQEAINVRLGGQTAKRKVGKLKTPLPSGGRGNSDIFTGGKDGLDGTVAETLRRPRAVLPISHSHPQKEYSKNDRVEVLDTSRGICGAWLTATIVKPIRMMELVLVSGKDGTPGHSSGRTDFVVQNGMETLSPAEGGTISRRGRETNGGVDVRYNNAESPRTVRSPVPPAATPLSRIRYVVEFENKIDKKTKRKVREEVAVSQLRPEPPDVNGYRSMCWRPDIGEAVEVLRHEAWRVAVVQIFVIRKGHLVSFENGESSWVRYPLIRPYQIWRGGNSWVTKTKPPRLLFRKSVGLSVTHPPGGKRKREAEDEVDVDEHKDNGKRLRTGVMDGSGPDGLPEGWRVDSMKRINENSDREVFYIAPDGQRLKSLKEAQRYVRMMGPQ